MLSSDSIRANASAVPQTVKSHRGALAPATDVRIVPVGGTLELSTPSRETVTS
jgi:hypothetical protein